MHLHRLDDWLQRLADGMGRGVQAHTNNDSAAYRLECMSFHWQLNSHETDLNESDDRQSTP